MESDENKSVEDASQPSVGRPQGLPAGRRRADPPSFAKELYWFALICLCGWVLAVSVLSPRLARDRSSRVVEAELRQAVQQLDKLEKEYDAAIVAVENDPFYRDEVYRNILGVKRDGEEFLKKEEPVSDN